MLYFTSTDISATNPSVSVTFKHLGSLFCITLKNTSSASLQNIGELRLVGVDGSSTWAYNSGAGGKTFDLVDEYLQNQASSGNQLSFKAKNNSLSAQGEATFWGWYPPLPSSVYNNYNKQPGLKLELMGADNTLTASSVNSKPPRPVVAVVGKSYYFYATWDGSNLGFTDNTFRPPSGPITIDVGTMGGLGAALGNQIGSISAMKVTGEINKTDFDVMKKSMPALTYLDLSDVTCDGNKIPDYAIGDNAWNQQNKTISTIILPNSITAIGNSAFSSSGIKGSLTLPASVTSIGSNAFFGCYGLTGPLNLPVGLTTLGEKAFIYCQNLTGALTIPSGITTLGKGAFYGCSGFTSLILPSGITAIGTIEDDLGLFGNCSGFTGALTIPAGVTTIGKFAFYGCGFTSLVVNTELKTIGDMAFNECYNFTGTLSLPAGLTTIGNEAFKGCSGFTGSLTIPMEASNIGVRSFQDCTGFTGSLTVLGKETTFGEGAFSGCTGFTGFTLPANTTTISAGIFAGLTGLTGSLDLSGYTQLTTIEENAFNDCSGFSGPLTLPTSLTTIGYGAFAGCTGFTGTLTLPASMTLIDDSMYGGGAFDGCTGFTGHLTIPVGLTAIGSYAFSNCTGFTGFTLSANTTTISAGLFDRCTGLTGSLDLSGYNQISTIKENAFSGCTGFTGFTLPANTTTISYELFAGCTGLTGSLDLSVYNQLTTIENSAFSGCTGFSGSLTLPTALTTIEGYAFSGTGFTGSLTMPTRLIKIGWSAFADCTGFTSLTFSNVSTLTTIEDSAFAGCSSITGTVTFPLSLTSIGEKAYLGTAITAFQFPHTSVFPYYKDNYYGYNNNMLNVSAKIQVPTDELVNAYKSAGGWKTFHIDKIEKY